MAEKKRKKQEEKNAPHALNYEDILNGFVREESPDARSTGASRTDLDGLALSELLGGDIRDTPSEAASGHFDAIGASDYSELARQFEELDLSGLSAENTNVETDGNAAPAEDETPEEPSGFPMNLQDEDGELSPEDTAEYTALLEKLEAGGNPDSEPQSSGMYDLTALPVEERAESDPLEWELLLEPEPEKSGEPVKLPDVPARTEVLSFVNLAENREESPSAPAIGETVVLPAPEPLSGEHEALNLSDLFGSKTEVTGIQAGEPSVLSAKVPDAAPMETAATGVDFLGLTALAPRENRPSGNSARRMEVLFEGVEMSFEDQTDDVTLAELLLAQGKKKEAVDLFQRVSQNKGTTFWVAKRLRALAASAD